MSNEVRMTYDYRKAVLNDVKKVIRYYDDEISECEDLDEVRCCLMDELWADDDVTGNGSGMYVHTRKEAEENLSGNTELLVEAIKEWGDQVEDYKKALMEPETGDVMIRCYLLDESIEKALEDPNIRKFVQDNIRKKNATSKNRKPASEYTKKKPVKRTATAKRTASTARRRAR